MPYVVSINGKPVRTASNRDRSLKYAQTQAQRRHPDDKFELTGTGKLVHMVGDRMIFTGWEIHEVQSVA